MRYNQLARDVRTGLLQEGLPLAYVERAIQELVDHAEDIEMESIPDDIPPSDRTATLEARLGSSQELVSHLAHTYRTHTFAGRHSLTWSMVIPILAIGFSILGLCLIGITSMYIVYEVLGYNVTDIRANITIGYLIHGSFSILPVLVAIVIGRQSINSGLKSRWLWLSCTLLAVLFSLMFILLRFPQAGPGSGYFSIGFQTHPNIMILIQILLVALFYDLKRYKDRHVKVTSCKNDSMLITD
jgi:hypothetical protein